MIHGATLNTCAHINLCLNMVDVDFECSEHIVICVKNRSDLNIYVN